MRAQIEAVTSELGGGIPLSTFWVRGSDGVALIDTGTRDHFPQVKARLDQIGVGPGDVRMLVNTHAHADHIGGNGQAVAAYRPVVAAPAGAEPWIEDFDVHLREFALSYPHIIPDSPEVRAEVLPLLDQPVRVHAALREGTTIALGSGVRLEVYELPGHVRFEIGLFETSTRTLILGDAIPGFAWNFIHGHLSPSALRGTLARLRRLGHELRVERLLTSHFPAGGPEELHELVSRASAYLDELEQTVLGAVRQAGRPCRLEEIWRTTCSRLGKRLEFRGLATVHAHLEEAVADGRLRRGEGEEEYRWP
jgi:glyoxylase-like metal-dependent hydrolase (beta-lactamase superfamily II)